MHDFESLPETFEIADVKVYTEYKQHNPEWADEEYWGKTVKRKGCGITVMAIVLSGYGEKDNPKDFQKNIIQYCFYLRLLLNL